MWISGSSRIASTATRIGAWIGYESTVRFVEMELGMVGRTCVQGADLKFYLEDGRHRCNGWFFWGQPWLILWTAQLLAWTWVVVVGQALRGTEVVVRSAFVPWILSWRPLPGQRYPQHLNSSGCVFLNIAIVCIISIVTTITFCSVTISVTITVVVIIRSILDHNNIPPFFLFFKCKIVEFVCYLCYVICCGAHGSVCLKVKGEWGLKGGSVSHHCTDKCQAERCRRTPHRLPS
mmetsp:Transcript_3717/g.3818  ORF Transcript_3717/g.3818 Transcript_3717/m.3818 type:complete len:234 (-) Transcript_3717:331-1032(-)